ncbi:unnamed protein product [Peronospora effusa]|nr:unnamed protein product [Peronospora effusa]
MPFGLKNAPQIYQQLIDNALYGYLKIGSSSDSITAELSKPIDLFTEGEPDTDPKPSVLGRRSYIDDILIPATSWTSLYEKVERLLEACNTWNLSISVAKSFWGRRKVDYLGHQVSLAGLETHPKDLESLVNIPFPRTLRSMQSFLGSLNYYSRFIEDFAIYAFVLYELREADFHEISRAGDVQMVTTGAGPNCDRQSLDKYKIDQDLKSGSRDGYIIDPESNTGDDHGFEGRNRWEKTTIAFTLSKAKIAATPILKHFDPERSPVIVVYASK